MQPKEMKTRVKQTEMQRRKEKDDKLQIHKDFEDNEIYKASMHKEEMRGKENKIRPSCNTTK